MTSRTSKRRGALLALVSVALVALVAAATALAAEPRSTSPPTVEGTFREGSTVTTSNGLWANNPSSYTYKWQRCDANGNNCATIKNQTGRNYKLRSADVGQTIISIVTARNSDGSDSANSKPTPVIADNSAPKNTKEPSISGSAVVGGTLTADSGSWTGAPSFTYRWRQCDAAGSACTDTGARGRTYGVRQADLGRTLRVEVTGKNPKGSSTAISNRTDVVKASGGGGGGGGGGGSAVAVSSVSLPDRLVLSGFSSNQIRNRDTPVTMKIQVKDTRGRLIQGALVYATAVPFGRVTTAPETATDSNGIATISVRATSKLELRRGTAVQFFLRARKPGDDLLAGVSTRRLVQIPIQP